MGRKKDQIGIVYRLCGTKPEKNNLFIIKEIDFVYDKIFLNSNIIKFINWIADYTLAPKGLVLKLFLVNKTIVSHRSKIQAESLFKPKLVKLNSEQKKFI